MTEIGGVILADGKVYASTLRLSNQRISGWLPYHRPDIHTGGVVKINRVMAIVGPREPGIRGWFRNWAQSRRDQQKLEELLRGTEGGSRGRISAPVWNPDGVRKFYLDQRTGQPIEEFAGYQQAARVASEVSFEALPRVAAKSFPRLAERF